MSAASWGLVTPAKGSPITPFRAPFETLASSVADALDKVDGQSFRRYPTRADLPSTGNNNRQHATVYADTVAGNNGDYYWNGTSWVLIGIFAQASGVLTYGASIGAGSFGTSTKVNFPSDRFTLAPIVTVTAGHSRVTCAYSAKTKDSFNIDTGNWSNAAVGAGFEISWIATQATATSATG